MGMLCKIARKLLTLWVEEYKINSLDSAIYQQLMPLCALVLQRSCLLVLPFSPAAP